MGARRPGVGVCREESPGTTAATKPDRLHWPELPWSEAPQGSHGVPLGSWSSTRPATVPAAAGLGLRSLHSQAVECGLLAAPGRDP